MIRASDSLSLKAAALFLCIVPGVVLFANSQESGSSKNLPSGGDLFKAKCVACHGSNGRGSPVGKSLGVADLQSKEIQRKSDAELFRIITEGNGDMPSFKSNTTTAEIRALVKHLRSLPGKK